MRLSAERSSRSRNKPCESPNFRFRRAVAHKRLFLQCSKYLPPNPCKPVARKDRPTYNEAVRGVAAASYLRARSRFRGKQAEHNRATNHCSRLATGDLPAGYTVHGQVLNDTMCRLAVRFWSDLPWGSPFRWQSITKDLEVSGETCRQMCVLKPGGGIRQLKLLWEVLEASCLDKLFATLRTRLGMSASAKVEHLECLRNENKSKEVWLCRDAFLVFTLCWATVRCRHVSCNTGTATGRLKSRPNAGWWWSMCICAAQPTTWTSCLGPSWLKARRRRLCAPIACSQVPAVS